MHDGSDVLERKRAELVLLEKVVEVLLEQLEDQARVVLVLETLVGADEVELVGVLLREPRQDVHLRRAFNTINSQSSSSSSP